MMGKVFFVGLIRKLNSDLGNFVKVDFWHNLAQLSISGVYPNFCTAVTITSGAVIDSS